MSSLNSNITMLLVIYSYCLAMVLAPLGVTATKHFRLASRQVFECGFSPVDCGDGWCCVFGETCQPAPNNGFVCIDSFLTNADGLVTAFLDRLEVQYDLLIELPGLIS